MSIKIAFVGDIMPGGVLNKKPAGVSNEVKKFLQQFDLRIGTLECAIGNIPTFDPVKMSLKQDVIYAPDSNLDKLIELGIDCVSLANNHAFDLGEDGLENTIAQLNKLGIAYCGAGKNIQEASKPAILEKNGLKIGIIGLCDNREHTVGYVPVASKKCAGMNSVSNDYLSQIYRLRPKVDLLYVVIHWGVEHTFWPDRNMLEFAKECINSGVDGIVGGHQHRIQPLITYKNRPIFLGLGNFLFPPRYLKPPRPMYYPDDEEDTSDYPVTDEYPWVTQPTYKIWKPLARIGAIGCVEIMDDGLKNYNMKIVEMTTDNVLVFPDKNPLSKFNQFELNIVRNSLPDNGKYLLFYGIKFLSRALRSSAVRSKLLIYKISKVFSH